MMQKRLFSFIYVNSAMPQAANTAVLIDLAAFDALRESTASASNLVLIDVRSPEHYSEGHLPGAIHLDYPRLLKVALPVGGLLPDAEDFNAVLRSLGVSESSHVVAYDGEGGAAASRLIWTLHAYDFFQCSVLNGGFTSWVAEGRDLDTTVPTINPTTITLERKASNVIDGDTLKTRIGDATLGLLDARTIEEFDGSKVRALHGGRIPGAQHFEWTDAIDPNGDKRLLPDATLTQMLEERSLTPDKDIVVYCQTHHRSALSYVMLKHLGYPSVMALDGAWSTWGNRDDTPKESG